MQRSHSPTLKPLINIPRFHFPHLKSDKCALWPTAMKVQCSYVPLIIKRKINEVLKQTWLETTSQRPSLASNKNSTSLVIDSSCKETREIRSTAIPNIRCRMSRKLIAEEGEQARNNVLHLNLRFSNDIFFQKPVTKCSRDSKNTAYTPSACRRNSFIELIHLIQKYQSTLSEEACTTQD